MPTQAQRRPMRVLAKEVVAFGIVGGLNFALDVGIYQAMYAGVGAGALSSKVVSTAVTSTVAYFLHRHWSFSHRARSGLRREFVLFAALSVASLAIGLVLLAAVRYGLSNSDIAVLQVANVTSILIGAVFRFWAYKHWVFLAPDAVAGPPGAAGADQAPPASEPGPRPQARSTTHGRS